MLSLGGIPPTLGFFGKYLVFFHAVTHGDTWLAIISAAAAPVVVEAAVAVAAPTSSRRLTLPVQIARKRQRLQCPSRLSPR